MHAFQETAPAHRAKSFFIEDLLSKPKSSLYPTPATAATSRAAELSLSAAAAATAASLAAAAGACLPGGRPTLPDFSYAHLPNPAAAAFLQQQYFAAPHPAFSHKPGDHPFLMPSASGQYEI